MKDSIRIVELEGRRLTLTNIDRPLWADDDYTKRDLIEYYTEMSEYLLPCLADRPLAVVRARDGAGEPGYQHRGMPALPPWIMVRRIKDGATSEGYVRVPVGADRVSLLYFANLGCISFHPWNSTFTASARPCELRFNLDAVELPFRDVRLAALLVRELLAVQGLRSWVKTSGGNGLHVMVPLEATQSFDQVTAFASAIVRQAIAREPKLLTVETRRNRRANQILVDAHRNTRGATLISAYSVRHRMGAPVSMPLEWAEVERTIYAEDFHARNARERIRANGDPFLEFFRSPQNFDQSSLVTPPRRRPR